MALKRVSPSRTGVSLRQRRSKSPPVELASSASSEESEPLIDATQKTRTTTTTTTHLLRLLRELSLPWRILIGTIGPIGVGLLVFAAVWILILTGLYNVDSDCAVPAFEYPDCSNAHMHVGEVAPPKTSEQWLELRESFHAALANAGYPPSSSSLADDWNQPNTVGFTDPSAIEFRILPGRGRAVMAKKFIPQGTKIWDSRHRAVFPDVCVARHFFNSRSDAEKCDFMFWGYVNNFYGNGIQYMLDLDGHGYVNHESNPTAVHHFEGELDQDRYCLSRLMRFPSLGIFPLSKEDWERRNKPGAYGLYAKRDIQVGEEITYDYEEIYMIELLHWFTIYIERSLPIWNWYTL